MQHFTDNCLSIDKCMLDVFKFFSLNDLLNASNVSQQFRRLAISTFQVKFRHLKLNNRTIDLTDKKIIDIFQTFGDCIEFLETPLNYYPWFKKDTQKLIIMLIKKYCADKALKVLKLHYFGSIGRYLVLMNNVFNNLNTLHLEYVAMPYSALQLINNLPLIKTLNLSYCIPVLPIFNTFRPIVNLNLNNLTLRCRDKFYTLDVLQVIHLLYPNITTLKFQMIGSFRPSNKIINALNNIGQLTSLSILDIDIECETMETLISNLTMNKHQLKHVCIRYALIPNDKIDYLSELTSVEELLITNSIGKTKINIYELIVKLPNLRLFSMIDSAISMQELSAIVRCSKKLIRAEFKMSSSVVNEFILQNMKYTIEKRKNKQPLWLTLHVNGQNDIDEFEQYKKNKNETSSLLHIYLTHKGVNVLAIRYGPYHTNYCTRKIPNNT